ncbi:radical SAM protein [Acetivibrio straminisolvens]|uniref:Radical SAM domain heme biosynthesis protein n=1 Tax=Acetivibrio straminisolvens JCM 21531 TaxID=1294263 RepID=W4V2N3_9FIRM|nr:radical SAM protein [Acetivibrio straminisolvens]GAE86969.1 radical SAM domain heme biosynthesis protein [Acetivibrio straminisolvens JCM 21531]
MQLERFFVDFLRVWNNEVCENYRTAAVHRVEFSKGYIELPVLSEVALTYACNIKCRFCYAGCTGVKKSRELDKEGFQKVLDIIRYEAEVPSVSFTGGEPLLNKNLPELIKYASKVNGMRVNLITNGTLITPKKAKELAKAGLSSAQVSIESPNASEHDSITGIPGSHEASVSGFKALKMRGFWFILILPFASKTRNRPWNIRSFVKKSARTGFRLIWLYLQAEAMTMN